MKTIILSLIIVISCKVIALDTTSVKYLPLKVGNVWVYVENYGYPYSGCFNYHKYSVTGVTNLNGKFYFNILVTTTWNNSTCQQGPPNIFSRLYSTFKIRIDSLNRNIYTADSCGTNINIPCDSLAAKFRDTSNFCVGGNSFLRETCTDTSLQTVMGIQRKTKSFTYPHPGGAESQSYAQNIGMYYSFWGESTIWWSETLRGCVINGILYGDTNTIVGVSQISSDVPKSFSLFQNYPNPFNPTTNIKFSISQKAFVTITIYNVLGEEVSKLVNEEFSPGTYETNWDASNYPSGVYFYQLTAGDYNSTKKMVLIK